VRALNCQQFDQIVVDLARDVNPEDGTSQDAADHAASCPRCALRLSNQRKLGVVLRAVNASASNEQAPASVEHSLLRAFQARFDRSEPATVVQTASPRRGGAATRRVWAVAAAAMLLLGPVVVWRLRPASPARSSDQASSLPATNKKVEELTAIGNGETQTASAVVRHGVSRPRRTAEYRVLAKLVNTPNETATTEVATRFYPLPYGSGLGLDEGWGLVRVQVPRASLASLGVPVSGGSASDVLTADVVVGQDGLAREIRFVQ
jgi:hypothetical protein